VNELLTFTVTEGNFEFSQNVLDILPDSTTTVAVKAAVVLIGHQRDGQGDGHLGVCYREATRMSVLSLLATSRSGKKNAGCFTTLRC